MIVGKARDHIYIVINCVLRLITQGFIAILLVVLLAFCHFSWLEYCGRQYD